jgi:hypothetical protein
MSSSTRTHSQMLCQLRALFRFYNLSTKVVNMPIFAVISLMFFSLPGVSHKYTGGRSAIEILTWIDHFLVPSVLVTSYEQLATLEQVSLVFVSPLFLPGIFLVSRKAMLLCSGRLARPIRWNQRLFSRLRAVFKLLPHIHSTLPSLPAEAS